MELSSTEVGEVTQIRVIECIYCNHRFAARMKGYYIDWFGKTIEYVFKDKVECERCLRDTPTEYQEV